MDCDAVIAIIHPKIPISYTLRRLGTYQTNSLKSKNCFSIVSVIPNRKKRIQSLCNCLRLIVRGPSWARTSDPLIMSQVLLTS
jgi:hypothetical protein